MPVPTHQSTEQCYASSNSRSAGPHHVRPPMRAKLVSHALDGMGVKSALKLASEDLDSNVIQIK